MFATKPMGLMAVAASFHVANAIQLLTRHVRPPTAAQSLYGIDGYEIKGYEIKGTGVVFYVRSPFVRSLENVLNNA